jgi:hypothetical protein
MTQEQNNKAGPVVNKQSRQELVDYVTGLINDALYPLTADERNEVLHSLVPVHVTINRNGSDAEVSVIPLVPGQIEVMISKAIRQQVGKVVASQINDPNSAVSRSIEKNIGPTRRRI